MENADAVLRLVEAQMAKIKASGRGIDGDNEIIVEIRSNGVPTIDLVDLPGLIVLDVKAGEPANLADQVGRCTEKYLRDVRTGGVVCVVAATTDNLNTSKAIRLCQDAQRRRPRLRLSTIGVFAKADKAGDASWADEERSGPYWRLTERLDPLGADGVKTSALGAGLIGLYNRNKENKAQANVTLQEQLKIEQDWIERPENKLTAEQKESMGLQALIGRMDQIISKHINDTWVPKQLQQIAVKEGALKQQLAALGLNPSQVTFDMLATSLVGRFSNTYLTPAKVDELCVQAIKDAKLPVPTAVPANATHTERVRANKANATAVQTCIANSTFANKLETSITKAIVLTFNEDSTGNIQLHRFTRVRDEFVKHAVSLIDAQADLFKKNAAESVDLVYKSSRGSVLDPAKLQAAITDCLLEFLLFPAVYAEFRAGSGGAGAYPFPFVNDAMTACRKDEKSYLTESTGATRLEIETKLRTLAEIKEKLLSFYNGEGDTGMMPSHTCICSTTLVMATGYKVWSTISQAEANPLTPLADKTGFTVREDGYFRVTCKVNGASAAANADHIALHVNGAAVAKAMVGFNTGLQSACHLNEIVKLSKDQTIKIHQQLSGNNLAAASDNYWAIELVAAPEDICIYSTTQQLTNGAKTWNAQTLTSQLVTSADNSTFEIREDGLYRVTAKVNGASTAANTNYLDVTLNGTVVARSWVGPITGQVACHLNEVFQLKQGQKLQIVQSFNGNNLNTVADNFLSIERLPEEWLSVFRTTVAGNGIKTWNQAVYEDRSVLSVSPDQKTFTAEADGFYRVTSKANGVSAGGNADLLAIYINGAAVTNAIVGLNTGHQIAAHINEILKLKQGQTIQIHQQFSGSNLANAYDNFLSIQYLGATL